LTLFSRACQDALQEDDQEKLVASLNQIEENAVHALKEMRLLLYEMGHRGFSDGFANSIDARFEMVERRLGIQATCLMDPLIFISPDVEETLFRIALEALNNSLKHANADQVQVILRRLKGGFAMEIRDNGRGFDPAAYSNNNANLSGMGLDNMRTRAAELGGNLEIFSSPGNGTEVRLMLDQNKRDVK
jgi:signal transduction histidine kinase